MGKRNGSAHNPQLACNLRGPTVETEAGLSARLADHLNLQPVDSKADAGAQRFGCRLFGGETRGETLGRVALASAVRLLPREKDAIKEASAIAIHGVLNARNFYHVDSGAGDHLVYQTTTFLRERACLSAVRGAGLGSSKETVHWNPEADSNDRIMFYPQLSIGDVSKAVMPVRLRNTTHPLQSDTDKRHVKMKMQETSRRQALSIPWALQMKAVSTEDPSRLVQTLTGAILGCGGWVLSRGANDTGRVNMLFEFERQACVDIYTILIAAGLELSQSGHVRLTELCQCTRSQQRDCGAEIASVDLEVQTFPPEIVVMQTSGPA